MSGDLVRVEPDGSACRITLNRPERHNALVPELLQELRRALARAARTQPAALVLAATGRSFSTGGDVKAFFEAGRGNRRRYAEAVVGALHAAILDLLRLPCPTVVAVQGPVTGGSLGLVLACDLVVAAPQARFAPWYVDVGFSPDGGWTALLPERIGRAHALQIQLLNRTLEAEEALRRGLIHELVPDGRLLARAGELVEVLARKRPQSVRRTLRLARPDPAAAAAALDAEYRSFLELIESDEAHVGMAEFLGRPA